MTGSGTVLPDGERPRFIDTDPADCLERQTFSYRSSLKRRGVRLMRFLTLGDFT